MPCAKAGQSSRKREYPEAGAEGNSSPIPKRVQGEKMAGEAAATIKQPGTACRSNSRLLGLPRELRDAIYEYVSPGLEESDRIAFGSVEESNHLRKRCSHLIDKRLLRLDDCGTELIIYVLADANPTLLSICSQIRREYREHLERRAVVRVVYNATLGMLGNAATGDQAPTRSLHCIKEAFQALIMSHGFVAKCRKWWFQFTVLSTDSFMGATVDTILDRAQPCVEVTIDYFFHHEAAKHRVYCRSWRRNVLILLSSRDAFSELSSYPLRTCANSKRVSRYIWMPDFGDSRCGNGVRVEEFLCPFYLKWFWNYRSQQGIDPDIVFMLAAVEPYNIHRGPTNLASSIQEEPAERREQENT